MLFEFNGKAFNTEKIIDIEAVPLYADWEDVADRPDPAKAKPGIRVYYNKGHETYEELPGTVQEFVAAQHEAEADIQARASIKIANANRPLSQEDAYKQAAGRKDWVGPRP